MRTGIHQSIYLPTELAEAAQAIAAKEERSLNQVLVRLIRTGLEAYLASFQSGK